MKPDIIRRIIKRQKNLYFAISIVCIVLGLIISMFMMNGIHDFLFGPFEKNVDDLLALPESRWDYYLLRETWITIDAEELYPISAVDTGLHGDRDQTHVIVAQLDDRLLIIQADCACTIDRLNSPNITGSIRTGDISNGDFYEEVRAEFRRHYPDIDAEFLSVTLDLSDHPLKSILLGLIFGIFFIGAGCSFFIQNIRLSRNPTVSKVVQRFAHYGDPEDILEQIEDEMRYMRIEEVDSKAHCLTQNWLLYAPSNRNNFFAMRYEDVVWVREMALNTLVYDRYGQTIPILSAGNSFKHIMHDKTPWAFHENTVQLRMNWQNRPKAFIESVDEKRLSYDKPKKDKRESSD